MRLAFADVTKRRMKLGKRNSIGIITKSLNGTTSITVGYNNSFELEFLTGLKNTIKNTSRLEI